MAMVPDREFRKPILIDDPEVSTHGAAAGAEPPVPAESTLDPQAVSARPRDRNTAVTAVLRMHGVLTGAFRFSRTGGAARRIPGCLRAALRCRGAAVTRAGEREEAGVAHAGVPRNGVIARNALTAGST